MAVFLAVVTGRGASSNSGAPKQYPVQWRGTCGLRVIRLTDRGFTLVELVIVLVLIGIIGAVSVGLFASPGTYAAKAARDQFVSSALLAQKQALANAGSDTSLTIEQTSEQWGFTVQQNGTEPELNCDDADFRCADRKQAELIIDSTSFSGSREFEFNDDGRLVSSNPVELEFVGTSKHMACLSSLGFAYPEECVD